MEGRRDSDLAKGIRPLEIRPVLWSGNFFSDRRYQGHGAGTFLEELLDWLRQRHPTYHLSELNVLQTQSPASTIDPRLVAAVDRLRDSARDLANEIAGCAPLAVQSTRATMRRGLADAVRAQTDHEFAEQSWLIRTDDHKEGVRAVAERRPGTFHAR